MDLSHYPSDTPKKVLRWIPVNSLDDIPEDKWRGVIRCSFVSDYVCEHNSAEVLRLLFESGQYDKVEYLEEAEAPAFAWTDELVKLFALQEINVYKNFDRSQLDHWMDRFKKQQSIETPAPGKYNCKKQMEEGGIGCPEECEFCRTNYRELFPKEAVPAQQAAGILTKEEREQGEVPEGIDRVIENLWKSSEYRTGGAPNTFRAGAIAMYHRDQEQIENLQHELDCAMSETLGYKKVYGLANKETAEAQEQIKALQYQIDNHLRPDIESYKLTIDMRKGELDDYRKTLEKIRDVSPIPISLARQVLDKYPSK